MSLAVSSQRMLLLLSGIILAVREVNQTQTNFWNRTKNAKKCFGLSLIT